MNKTFSDDKIPIGEISYVRESVKNMAHQMVLQKFLEIKERGYTRAVLARRLGKKPEQITRWLSAPGNWTLDTFSDLMFAMGADPEAVFMRSATARQSDGAHDIITQIATSNETSSSLPPRVSALSQLSSILPQQTRRATTGPRDETRTTPKSATCALYSDRGTTQVRNKRTMVSA
jgi:DNA-binding phage protein